MMMSIIKSVQDKQRETLSFQTQWIVNTMQGQGHLIVSVPIESKSDIGIAFVIVDQDRNEITTLDKPLTTIEVLDSIRLIEEHCTKPREL